MTAGGSGRDAFRSRSVDRQVAKVAEDRPRTALREPPRGSRKSPSGTSSKAQSWRANARERPTGERLVAAASVQFAATVSESCALGWLPHGGRRTFAGWIADRDRRKGRRLPYGSGKRSVRVLSVRAEDETTGRSRLGACRLPRRYPRKSRKSARQCPKRPTEPAVAPRISARATAPSAPERSR